MRRRCRRAVVLSIAGARFTDRDAFSTLMRFGWSRILLPLGAAFGSLWKHACNSSSLTSLTACGFSRTFDLCSLVLVPCMRASFCRMRSQVTPFEHGIRCMQALIVDIRQKYDCLPSWIYFRFPQSYLRKRLCRTFCFLSLFPELGFFGSEPQYLKVEMCAS